MVNLFTSKDFDFKYGLSSDIRQDQITLSTRNVMEKLAVSFALAQSIKLSVYENVVEAEIEQTKDIPQDLATLKKNNNKTTTTTN